MVRQALFNLFNHCSNLTSQFNIRFLYVIKYLLLVSNH